MQQIPPFPRKIKDLMTCDLPKEQNQWTSIEDALLEMMLKCQPSWTYAEIAKTCFKDRNYDSVYNRIKRLNLDQKYPRH